MIPNKSLIGKTFLEKIKEILAAINELDPEEIHFPMTIFGETITGEMLLIKRNIQMVYGKWIFPSVIEPSFGIGRILMAMLDHSYREIVYSDTQGRDQVRSYFSLKSVIAPVKCD
jgi:glycyl-tRNA synthetase